MNPYKFQPIKNTNKRTMKLSHKELREGNLIYQGNQYGIFPVSAYQIYQYSLYCKGTKVADYYSEWKPIELTEQWLKDFGFTFLLKEGESVLYRLNSNDVNIHPIGGLTYGNRGRPLCKIKYVHSLQNLYFALTETELTNKEH